MQIRTFDVKCGVMDEERPETVTKRKGNGPVEDFR